LLSLAKAAIFVATTSILAPQVWISAKKGLAVAANKFARVAEARPSAAKKFD
jgi:hypothetical protein